MIYRYEIYLDGNDDDVVGLFSGLDTLEDDDFVETLVKPFDMQLPIPPEFKDLAPHSLSSYFTEEGNKKFHEAILNIIYKYLDVGLFRVACIKMDEKNLGFDDIFYKDRYQVSIKKSSENKSICMADDEYWIGEMEKFGMDVADLKACSKLSQ